MTGPRRPSRATTTSCRRSAGWMELTGEPDGPPTKSGLSLVDYSGGFVAAISLLAGIHAARRDGVGMDCDVSLYDTAIGMLTYPAAWHLNAGFTPTRTRHSAHPSLVPFQAFEAKDGWLVVGCAKEKFWQRLTVVIERPEWADRPALRDLRRPRPQPRRAAAAARGDLRHSGRSPSGSSRCAPPRSRAAPINDVEAALAEPHTIARGLIVETEHPRYGTVRQVASPVRVGDEPPAYRRAPLRNEDAGRILGELLGYDAAAVADLTRPRAPSGPLDRTVTVASDLAAWALGLRRSDVPDEVVAPRARHLLDGLGTAIAAGRARRGRARPHGRRRARRTARGDPARPRHPGLRSRRRAGDRHAGARARLRRHPRRRAGARHRRGAARAAGRRRAGRADRRRGAGRRGRRLRDGLPDRRRRAARLPRARHARHPRLRASSPPRWSPPG